MRRQSGGYGLVELLAAVLVLSVAMAAVVVVFATQGRAYLRADTQADRKSTRLNSSHGYISYAVFCLKKKKNKSIARLGRKEQNDNQQQIGQQESTVPSDRLQQS